MNLLRISRLAYNTLTVSAPIARHHQTKITIQMPNLMPAKKCYNYAITILAFVSHTTLSQTPAVAETIVTDRPNILFIIADDASRDSMGIYGSTYVETPNFDRIAREGVLFTQAYNCNPKCAPARACLLTGRYSWQLQEACNHNPFLSDQWAFYPFLLEDAGYCVGYTGKGWGPGEFRGYDASRTKDKINPAGHPFLTKKLKPPYKGINSIDYAGNFQEF